MPTALVRSSSISVRDHCEVAQFSLIHREYPHVVDSAAVEGAEDPERILEQAVTDMNSDIIKLRQATAKVRVSSNPVLSVRTYYAGANKYRCTSSTHGSWTLMIIIICLASMFKISHLALCR